MILRPQLDAAHKELAERVGFAPFSCTKKNGIDELTVLALVGAGYAKIERDIPDHGLTVYRLFCL